MKLKEREFTRQAITYFVVTGFACVGMVAASVITVMDLVGFHDFGLWFDVSLLAAVGSIIVSVVLKKEAEASMFESEANQNVTEGVQ